MIVDKYKLNKTLRQHQVTLNTLILIDLLRILSIYPQLLTLSIMRMLDR